MDASSFVLAKTLFPGEIARRICPVPPDYRSAADLPLQETIPPVARPLSNTRNHRKNENKRQNGD
jgi:hypothetical protein